MLLGTLLSYSVRFGVVRWAFTWPRGTGRVGLLVRPLGAVEVTGTASYIICVQNGRILALMFSGILQNDVLILNPFLISILFIAKEKKITIEHDMSAIITFK